MPGSWREGKRAIAIYLRCLFGAGEEVRILDVGPGEGTYARLLRPALPKAEFICLEIFEPYRERFGLDKLYDRVIIGDARTYEPDFPADVVIFGDVLEHMAREEALDVLRRHCARARAVVVSVPIVPFPQGAIGGNPHEVHRDQWTYESFLADAARLGARVGLSLRGRRAGVFILGGERGGPAVRLVAAALKLSHVPYHANRRLRRRVKFLLRGRGERREKA